MGEQIKIGDTVELTIRGKVGEFVSTHANCHRISAETGNVHYVFFGGRHALPKDGDSKHGVTVKKITPPENLEPGQAYMDADGDIFIRNHDDGWTSPSGNKRPDGYALRPLRKLVPEK